MSTTPGAHDSKSSEKHLHRRKNHSSINSYPGLLTDFRTTQPWSLQTNKTWARDSIENQCLVSGQLSKTRWALTWACDMFTWHWSVTIAWMLNIKDTHCKPRLQNLVLTRIRPPCCVTSSLGARARDPCLPWRKSCMGFYACIWSCSYSYGAPLGGPSSRRSSAIKRSRRCFIGYPNTSNSVKNTPLRAVFSTLFSVFGYPDETMSLVFDILRQLRKTRPVPGSCLPY